MPNKAGWQGGTYGEHLPLEATPLSRQTIIIVRKMYVQTQRMGIGNLCTGSVGVLSVKGD